MEKFERLIKKARQQAIRNDHVIERFRRFKNRGGGELAIVYCLRCGKSVTVDPMHSEEKYIRGTAITDKCNPFGLAT